jgi:hypothetical protein
MSLFSLKWIEPSSCQAAEVVGSTPPPGPFLSIWLTNALN